MPFSNLKDREVAEKVLSALQSEKYNSKNYLFLQPFDPSQTPGYLETIGKPLDLDTVSKNLQNDLYDEVSFWKELSNVFNNAIKYHGGKETKWIAQMATSMLKYMNKERKKAEMGEQSESVPGMELDEAVLERKKAKKKLKIKLKQSPDIGGNSVLEDVRSSYEAESNVSSSPHVKTKLKRQKSLAEDSLSSPLESEPPLKKAKLKLKLATSSKPKLEGHATDNDPATKVSSLASSPEAKFRQTSVPLIEESVMPEKVKSSKPKLKLKLSLKPKKVDTGSINSDGSPTLSNDMNDKSKKFASKSEEKNDSKMMKKSKPSESTFNNASGNGMNSVSDKDSRSIIKSEGKGSTDDKKLKVSVKHNPGNRGKELPKAVAASQQLEMAASTVAPSNVATSQATIAKPAKKKNLLNLKKSVVGSSGAKKLPIDVGVSANDLTKGRLTPKSGQLSNEKTKLKGSVAVVTQGEGGRDQADLVRKQCTKVLASLRRSHQKNIKWFSFPISDKKILIEYNAKIKHPMDLQTLQLNLDKGTYDGNASLFSLELRRIFANALQFNTAMKDSLRPVAVEVLQTAEDLLKVFLSSEKVGSQSCPSLLYCWKLCIDILNTIYKLENPTDGQPLALYFFHPVTYFWGGETPPGYSEKVKRPMDFGTVTVNLIEGRYQAVDAFAADCRLIISNCTTYYEGREDDKIYAEQASKLNECLSQQLDQLARYDKSPKAASDRSKAKEIPVLPKPQASLLLSIVSDLRSLKYTDKATKITQPAMGPFEEPVSLVTYPDYGQVIREKMDLQTIERKVKSAGYDIAEDFEYDINLLFKNYEEYNNHRNTQHVGAIAKFAARKFRQIFAAKFRSGGDDQISVLPFKVERQNSMATLPDLQPEKTSSTSPSSMGKKAKSDPMVVAKKKVAPRISITSTSTSSIPNPAPAPSARSKSPAPKKQAATPLAPLPKPKSKPNQPVPLHIAIARVKEGFPIRRAVKTLQSWEADCALYFKELMRHPWISAARPKFIFHVPVPVLFPDLCDTYAAKIKNPIDLTTIECSLLSGNKYSGPEDFVSDVALVFTNAILFNEDGKDIGDPLSCAYYDASVHLLRYSRWLSLEILTDYVDDTDHTDLPNAEGLPPFSWSLTSGNRARVREEMESLVLKEPIDVSLEGDRGTWHEAECEKLLKALRHQSDLKHMTFFIVPDYPPDYAAYIAKPMDREKVQRMLKKGQYLVFEDFISDLRLIFTNALKYNAKHKGTKTDSGRAYDAANVMSLKLEAAISKMMLTVSDRLERERIDHANAEREIEAAERAEEAQIRAAWKKEPNSKEEASSLPNVSVSVSQKIRSVRRVTHQQNTDFEIPFFDDEDDGMHESSYFEFVKFQKAMFEKQRQELLSMHKTSKSIGLGVISRLVQHQIGKQWAEEGKDDQREKQNDSIIAKSTVEDAEMTNPEKQSRGSTALETLSRDGRALVQIKIKQPKKKSVTKKMPLIDLG